MKPRKAEKSRAPATTGDASSAPATASKGGKLPTVSGTGPGEWNDALVAGVVQVCAGSDLRGDDMGAATKRVRAGIEAMAGIGSDDVIADMVGRAARLGASHGDGLLQAGDGGRCPA